MAKNAAIPVGNMTALRQSGMSEWHDKACECRKCRRARKAAAKRKMPKYGQGGWGAGPGKPF